MGGSPPVEAVGRFRWLARIASAPLRWFAAHDVFISYARRDAHAYALALANSLQREHGLSCGLDLLESLPGHRTPSRVMRYARWSRSRLVLATSASLGSSEMGREIAEFAAYPAPVVIIAPPGLDLSQALWRPHVPGVQPRLEAGGQAAFEEGTVAPAVLSFVLDVMRFTRRERRIAAGALVGAGVTVLGAVLTLWFGWRADEALEQAQASERVAAQAQVAASAANTQAEAARAEAAQAASAAAVARADRDLQAGLADLQRARAEAEERRAAEARRQGDATVAALEAEALLRASPARLTEALQAARRSVVLAPTAGGLSVLSRGLQLAPQPLASGQSGCSADRWAVDPGGRWVVTGTSQGLCAVDLATLRTTARWSPPDDMLDLLVAGAGGVLYAGSRYGGAPATAWLLDPTAGFRRMAELPAPADLGAAAFRADGALAALGTQDGRVALLAPDGGPRWQTVAVIDGRGVHQTIGRLEWAPDGAHLVVASASAIEVWAMHDPSAPRRHWQMILPPDSLPGTASAPALALDSAGARLVVAQRDAVLVHGFPAMALLQRIPEPQVDALALPAPGRLVVHSAQGRFQAYHPDSAGLFVPHRYDQRLPGGLPTGRRLATAASGSHLWTFAVQDGDKAHWASLRRVADGQERARIGHQTYLRDLVPLDGGARWLAIGGDDSLRLWGDPLSTGASTWHQEKEADLAAIDADGSEAVIGVAALLGFGERQLEAWTLDESRLRHAAPLRRTARALRLLDSDTLDLFDESGWWRSTRGVAGPFEPRATLPPRDRCRERVVAWGEGRDAVVASGASGELWIADPAQAGGWRRIALPLPPASCVRAVAVDALLRTVAVSSMGARARVDVFTLPEGRRLAGWPTPYLVRNLTLDPSGRRLALGTHDAPVSRHATGEPMLEIRDLPTGELRARLPVPGGGMYSAVCLGPDGRRVATEGAALARVWALDAAGRVDGPPLSFELAGTARHCQFTRDGSRLVMLDRHGLRRLTLDPAGMLALADRRLGAAAPASISPR